MTNYRSDTMYGLQCILLSPVRILLETSKALLFHTTPNHVIPYLPP